MDEHPQQPSDQEQPLGVSLEERTRQVVVARDAVVMARAAVQRWVEPFKEPIGRYFSASNAEHGRALMSGRLAKVTGVARRRTRRVEQAYPDISEKSIHDPAVAQYFADFDGPGLAYAARLARRATDVLAAVPIDERTRKIRLQHAERIKGAVREGDMLPDRWLAREAADQVLRVMPSATHEPVALAEAPAVKALFADHVIEGLEAGRTDLLVKDVVRLAGATQDAVELLQFILEGIDREGSHLLEVGGLSMASTDAEAAEIKSILRAPKGRSLPGSAAQRPTGPASGPGYAPGPGSL